MKSERLEKIKHLIHRYELDAILIKSLENIFYLSGFRGSDGLLVVTRGDVILITDFRYITYAKEATEGVVIMERKKDLYPLSTIVRDYDLKRVGFESLYTPYALYQEWQDKLKECEFFPLRSEIDEVRRSKEPDEVDKIRNAVRIAEEAFMEVYEGIRPGKSEKEIAAELDFAMIRRGAEKPSFDTIVAAGERSALPHAKPSNRKIKEGDVVIVDFGAQYEGYCSDETCTIFVGNPPNLLWEIHEIVYEAKQRALDAISVGIPLKKIDSIVRGYIEEKGYGSYFGHGTGHGIGINVHELPQINETAEGVFEENMVVTIEPGIYIPNVGGVRLEDMVLVREGYSTVLTGIRKDLFLL
ncbi:MAG: Xaa-Pro peptidase family protein [Deltaproteobacteria bacterium]|nr:Xaa-Pro peptidase family protein [Deltaproteobacteria bacterium]